MTLPSPDPVSWAGRGVPSEVKSTVLLKLHLKQYDFFALLFYEFDQALSRDFGVVDEGKCLLDWYGRNDKMVVKFHDIPI